MKGFVDDISVDGNSARVRIGSSITLLLLGAKNGGVDFKVFPQYRKPYLAAMRIRKLEQQKDAIDEKIRAIRYRAMGLEP